MKRQLATEWLEKEFIKLEQSIGVHNEFYRLIELSKQKELGNLEDANIKAQIELTGDSGLFHKQIFKEYIKETYGIDK